MVERVPASVLDERQLCSPSIKVIYIKLGVDRVVRDRTEGPIPDAQQWQHLPLIL